MLLLVTMDRLILMIREVRRKKKKEEKSFDIYIFMYIREFFLEVLSKVV